MKSQIQLILATIGLTILIWVYADQQGYRTVKFPIAIRIATLPDYVPRIADAGQESQGVGLVTVIARGPNSALRELNLSRPPVFEVTVAVTENVTTGAQRVIDIHDEVVAALRQRGLQLLSVNPSSLAVTLDHWEKHTVEVQADTGAFAEALKGSLGIEPPTVTAKILASELQSAAGAVDNRLVLHVEDQLRTQPAQAEFEFLVSLKDKKWQGLKVIWEPDVVRIRGRLQQQYEDFELKLIPLRAMLPWDRPCDKYQIVWADERDRLQKVALKVPVGKPKALTNNDVVAFIAIDESLIPPQPPGESAALAATQPAAEPSPYSQTVRFVFPEGFEDVKIVSPPSVVKFRVVKRPQTTTATPSTTDGR